MNLFTQRLNSINPLQNGAFIYLLIVLQTHASFAASRTSANYSTITETVDMAGGISTSASYSTIGCAGLISGVAAVGAPSVLAKSGYIGQLDEVAPPEIELRQPTFTSIPDGGIKNFGAVAVNGNTSLIFTIKNTGDGDLTGLGITFDGTDPGAFSLTAQPVSPVPGPHGSTTFTVQFAPTTSGPETAALHIANNDPDESPFDITLLGNVSAQEAWRQTHFGSIENSGDGADLNDYEGDGLVNLIEFAFGLNPKQNSAGQLPQGQIIGSNYVVFFNQPSGVSGITYVAGWSAALLQLSWTPIIDTGVPPQHVFSVPIGGNTRMFTRFTVTNP